MHHVVRGGVGQGLGDLERVADGLGQRERAFLLDQDADVDPFDELEDDVGKPRSSPTW